MQKTTDNVISRRRYLVMLSVLFLLSCFSYSCYSHHHFDTWEKVNVKCTFTQALLKDCVSFLSQQSGIDIQLSPEVQKIDNLYVDLPLNIHTGYTLKTVLSMIIDFVKKQHHLSLYIKENSQQSIVLDLSGNNGKTSEKP